jgi:hypothetical protein
MAPGSVDAAFFAQHGYAAFSTGASAGDITRWTALADDSLRRYLDLAAATGFPVTPGKENGFRELVMKDANRYDCNFDNAPANDPTAAAFSRTMEDHIAMVAGPLLREVLGPSYKKNSQGMVTSQLGAHAQGWHVDSSHLFVGPPGQYGPLPCHFVTAFVPCSALRYKSAPRRWSPVRTKSRATLPTRRFPINTPPQRKQRPLSMLVEVAQGCSTSTQETSS